MLLDTDGLWLCKGFGCREQVPEGKWRSKSCWSKANQKRQEGHGNKPDTFCMECNSPVCSNPQCTTCQRCRKVTCKNQACTDEPKPLNINALAQAKKRGYAQYLCLRCQGVICWRCGMEMTKIQKERKRAKGKDAVKEKWFCQKCNK